MDLATGIAITAAVVYVIETAGKYGYALLKKIARARAGQTDTLLKKVRRATTLEPLPLRFCDESTVHSGLHSFSLKKIVFS
jgi:hypothetical protein